MKKAIKCIISIALVFTFVFGQLAMAVPEDGINWDFGLKAFAATSGTCGADLTWTLDDEGTLTISGTGDMEWGSPWDVTLVKNVVIGNGVTSIGRDAFSGCTSLESVTIGNNVTEFVMNAFNGCCSLLSINIPDGTTYIGSYVFSGCTSLKSVTIPDSVTVMGYGVFENCTSLMSAKIPNGVTRIGDDLFSGCTSLESVTIPESVTSIGKYAFYDCTSLKTVTIPDSVISIGYLAFFRCTSIENVSIPDSVTSIGHDAFGDCTSLKTLSIGNGVTDISNSQFDNCVSLEKVTIGNSVTEIDGFYNCYSLKEVHISNIEAWCTMFYGKEIANPLYYADNLYLNGELVTDLVIPNGVTSIGSYAFFNCASLTSVTIPDSVTSIGHWAFKNCKSLTSITIPDSVTSIGSEAFFYCTSLKNIVIPERVTSIGSDTFYECTSLESVTIPNSVTGIGERAFYNCYSLNEVHISSIKAWCGISFGGEYGHHYTNPLCFGNNLYLNGELVTDLVIPDGVTSIGNYAFIDCTSLTRVTIPDNVTSIGNHAFEDCTSLTSVEIPDSVTSIGRSAFYGCNSLTSVEIPNSVTSIGDYAFKDCDSLTDIEIPDSVTSIGNYAFDDCQWLDSVTILNPECYFYSSDSIYYGATIYGYSGSTAETYAKKYNREFVAIDKPMSSISDILVADGQYAIMITGGEYPVVGAEVALGESFGITDEDGLVMLEANIDDIISSLTIVVDGNIEYETPLYVLKDTRKDIINLNGVMVTGGGGSSEEGTEEIPQKNFSHIYSVQMLYNGGYTELLTTPKTIDLIYKDTPFSIKVLSKLDNISKYELVLLPCSGGGFRDQEISIAESSSGEFNLKIDDFKYDIEKNPDNRIYVYSYDEEGNRNGKVELQLSVVHGDEVKKAVESFSLGNSISYTFGEDELGGILAGKSITLPMIDIPFNVKIAEDSFAVGINLFDVSTSTTSKYNELKTKSDSFVLSDIFTEEYELEEEFWKKFESITDKWDDYVNRRDNKDKKQNAIDKALFGSKNGAVTKNGVNVGFTGYMEGKIKEGKISSITGRLAIKVSASIGTTFQGFWGTVPVIAEFKITGSAQADGSITIKFDPLDSDAELLLKLGLQLEGSAGIGTDGINIQFYGKIGLDVSFIIKHQNSGLKSIYASGEIGAKAELLWLEGEFPIWKGGKYLYNVDTGRASGNSVSGADTPVSNSDLPLPDDQISEEPTIEEPIVEETQEEPQTEDVTPEEMQSDEELISDYIYNISAYELASRDYVNDRSEWLGESGLKGAMFNAGTSDYLDVDVLQTSGYTGMVPQLVTCGDTTMLVYTDDIADRADLDRTAIVYSVYDDVSASWSEPVIIDDDLTADFNPSVYSDENGIWVAWQDAKEVYGPAPSDGEVNIAALVNDIELCTAFYDVKTGEWTKLAQVTDNAEYERQFAISGDGNKTYLIWVVNEEEDIFGQNSSNTIKYSVYENGAWGEEGVCLEGQNPVIAIDAGVIDGKIHYALSMDGDCSLSTLEDVELYVGSVDSTLVRVTENQMPEYNPNFVRYNGEDVLSWNAGGNMFVLQDINSIPTQLISDETAYIDSDAVLISSGNKNVIMYTQNADEASQIYTVEYDAENGEWGCPIVHTQQEHYIKNASGAFVNDRLVTVFNQIEVEQTTDQLDQTYNLCWLKLEPRNDLEVTGVSVDYKSIAPSAETVVEIEVLNNGGTTIDSVNAVIQDEYGNILVNETIECTLLSGQNGIVILYVTLPDEITDTVYSVSVIANSVEEDNTDNNSTDIRFGYADLVVDTEKVVINNADVVLATVTNVGYVPAYGTLKMTNESGEVMYQEDIPELDNNEMVQFVINISNDHYFDDVNADVANIEVISSEEEKNVANNSEMIVLERHDRYVQNVTFSSENATVYVGQSTKLNLVFVPDNAENRNVAWSCSDTSIAVVDEYGIVTGRKEGSATVYAVTEDGGLTDEITVTVEPVSAQLSDDKVVVKLGQTYKLSATTVPDNLEMLWTSSDESVATVDENGKITTVGIGGTTITASVKSGGCEVSCPVYVVEAVLDSNAETAMVTGSEIELIASLEGMAGDFSYRFYYLNENNEETIISDYAGSNTCIWTPYVRGSYKVYCDVMDQDGNVFTADMECQILDAVFNSNLPSPQNIKTPITLVAAGGHTYKFYYEMNGKWISIQNYSTSNTCVWTPTVPHDYLIYCDVKDEAGNVIACLRMPYTITDVYGLAANLSSPQNIGTKIELTASGGSSYKFYYEYNGIWGKIRDYASESSCVWTPAYAGDYQLYVDVKDENGQLVTCRTLDYTVSDPFSFTADLSGVQAVGTDITLNAEGGSTYKFYYEMNGKWGRIKDFSSDSECVWNPVNAGVYQLYVDIKDENGVTVQCRRMRYEISDPYSISADVDSLDAPGATVTLSSSGGNCYKFYYELNGNWIRIRDFASRNYCKWTPTEEGKYTLYVDINDEDGNLLACKKMSFNVGSSGSEDTETKTYSLTSSLTSPRNLGTGITLTADGGTTYKFYYEYKGMWSKIQDYSSSNICTWKPNKAGEYQLYVDIKDERGVLVTCRTLNFVVNDPYSFTTTADLTQRAGNAIEFNAEGGKEYKFYYEKDGAWVRVQNFSAANTCTWTPTQPGKYNFYCDIKDESGSVAICKRITFNITERFTLVADRTVVQKGESITFNATGGSQYKFYYELDGKWVRVQSFSAANTCIWTPSAAGEYMVYVDVNDVNGKTIGCKGVQITVQ